MAVIEPMLYRRHFPLGSCSSVWGSWITKLAINQFLVPYAPLLQRAITVNYFLETNYWSADAKKCMAFEVEPNHLLLGLNSSKISQQLCWPVYPPGALVRQLEASVGRNKLSWLLRLIWNISRFLSSSLHTLRVWLQSIKGEAFSLYYIINKLISTSLKMTPHFRNCFCYCVSSYCVVKAVSECMNKASTV